MPESTLGLSAAHRRLPAGPALCTLALAALAALLVVHGLQNALPRTLWWQALWSPDLDDVRQVLMHYSFYPRLLVSLMAGAALALAGTLFQQILRNPLAEPVTLGVSAGANLALSAATIFAPTLLVHGLEAVTLTGAAIATGLLFAFAWGRTLSPLRFILAGMVISLYCVSLNALLVLFNHDYLIDLLLWQAGSLNQSGWDGVLYLAPRLAIALVTALLMVRPLAALGLDDEGASAVGVNLRRTRVLGLAVAVALSAFVTSAVGMLAFVGLAAPAIARLCGARTLRQRLVWAPLLGAALLCVVDQIARELSRLAGEIPAGILTGVFSVPLLLWLLGRQRSGGILPRPAAARPQREHPWRMIGAAAILLALLTLPAIYFAVDANGWHWGDAGLSEAIMQWRLPRVLGALAAGAMLAVAGLLVQRLTGNPMASPEVLGATSGSAIAVLVLFLVMPQPQPYMVPAASAGALLTLGLLLWFAWRRTFNAERLLLTGVCLTTLLHSLSTLLLASGDPRMTAMMSWMTGSTYQVDAVSASTGLAVGSVMIGISLLMARQLDLLTLGNGTATALGLHLRASHLAILLTAAVLTASATIIVGPLSFVGLIGPHIARHLGVRRAAPQLLLSAVAGALIMVVADWLGRNIAYPWPVSAGLLAAFIGCPYFLWLMHRERTA
ncbi:Fe(3+)-hydroxamate ABC transporter permease FhuB [Pseudomonas sp. ZM23]|uniref:Fe(3+)-hydroxamate ABC transporter permease FhuB n=1 Tax=Pseudomonas triclosanedens TaxID=2961893 RepID=A0ABY7A6Z6_9PSED|nr:Fe(3+)-hydroxamate ABC transporter permease FhuB [Pseudomonas triclosanedens]MCP8466328.1 Fe(3+)-hydroxamate ABC transporter permease FhuB [Pseudomonas triclosanedens]MCP8471854.1 Fe(3+)-hydroxamate ABC transporter permease FhuB [Pseudomonas triclosanedens]MCP8478549.1 Fe(3+)-hydroxamate ABC transporter permease FhuB [Pseudomonas triclosanedens]WAI52256.1 Fe(3+)-hydroxamate ABC transporter permease FhuB [Pseudomonas triclosanedens]